MLEILFEVLFACDQLQTGLLCETSISLAAPPPLALYTYALESGFTFFHPVEVS